MSRCLPEASSSCDILYAMLCFYIYIYIYSCVGLYIYLCICLADIKGLCTVSFYVWLINGLLHLIYISLKFVSIIHVLALFLGICCLGKGRCKAKMVFQFINLANGSGESLPAWDLILK